jgi:uncharacterized protein (TIGR02246 family)
MRRILMVFLLAFWAPCGTAAAAAPQGSGKAAIHTALIKWTRALASGQGGKPVAALYARDAILLATFAAEPLTTPAAIAAYFRQLTAKPDLRATVESEKIDLFGTDGAADTGLYTFSYRAGGKEVRVPARFTFVWRKTGKGWLIVSHQSSVVPPAH